MAVSFFKHIKAPSEVVSDIVDVDVTPVMNMFIILIPFLISMAVFTHLSIVEFSLPPNITSALDTSSKMPELKVTVVVAQAYVALTLGEEMLDSLPGTGTTFNYTLFSERLKFQRSKLQNQRDIAVAVKDGIQFQNVISIMDKCRESGFENIGLSAAPDNIEGSLE